MLSLFDLFKGIFETLLKLCPEGNTEEILKNNEKKHKKLKIVNEHLNKIEGELTWRKNQNRNFYY